MEEVLDGSCSFLAVVGVLLNVGNVLFSLCVVVIDLFGFVFAMEVPVFGGASGACAAWVSANICGDDFGCEEAVAEARGSCHDGGEVLFPDSHLVIGGRWGFGVGVAEVEILDMFSQPSRVGGVEGGVSVDDVGRS